MRFEYTGYRYLHPFVAFLHSYTPPWLPICQLIFHFVVVLVVLLWRQKIQKF